MKGTETSREELLALFAAMATAPPSEEKVLLVEHLKSKESVLLADSVADAISRYSDSASQRLPAPSELLPPLG